MIRSLKQQRRDARAIFAAGLAAADPALLIQRCLQVDGQVLRAGERLYDLTKYGDLYLVGAGKATADGARRGSIVGRKDCRGYHNCQIGDIGFH